MSSPATPPVATQPIWDPLLRGAHWLLVASVAASWLTHDNAGRWHEWLGYVALAVVAVRIVWGFVGPRHARFAQFVRPPAATLAYAASVLLHREPRHVGHNPLGAAMVLVLLALVAATGASGWLYTTDAFWGVEWVEELHEACADLLLAAIGLHIAGVIFTSLRQRENLVAAMFHGRKRPAAGDEVD